MLSTPAFAAVNATLWIIAVVNSSGMVRPARVSRKNGKERDPHRVARRDERFVQNVVVVDQDCDRRTLARYATQPVLCEVDDVEPLLAQSGD